LENRQTCQAAWLRGGAETTASRREEDSETPDRCFANLLKRRAVSELFAVDPNGMASAAAEGCLTREPF